MTATTNSAGQDAVVRSSSDIKALTYCDLKAVHMGGLVEVLRLYPEYQHQFANDIQHDLTFNLREGYECQDSDIGPIFPLPSISEDDENQQEGEVNQNDVDNGAATATTVSPHHSNSTPSPLHGRSPLLGINSPRLLKLRRRGRSVLTLRERVERQRSINVISSVDTTSLDEDPNDDGHEEDEYLNHKRHSLERLDSQVSTLHQDMTQLSLEVRNALQALQEATFSTMASQASLKFPPARSIPNISTSVVAGINCPFIGSEESALHRSTSHPPEIWGREFRRMQSYLYTNANDLPQRPNRTTNFPPSALPNGVGQKSCATQTDFQNQDLRTFEHFVTANPRLVLGLLGITSDTKTEVDNHQLQKTLQISPLNTIEKVLSPTACVKEPIHRFNSASYFPSIDNHTSSDFNFEISNSGSADALLGADELLSPATLSYEFFPHNVQTCDSQQDTNGKVYKSISSLSNNSSCSSSCSSINTTRSVAVVSSVYKIADDRTLTSKPQSRKIQRSRSSEHKRLPKNGAESSIASSFSANPPHAEEQAAKSLKEPITHSTFIQPEHNQQDNSFFKRRSLLVHSRTIKSQSKSPTYRFSAGDADNLEKGIRAMPSTHSLRDNTLK